MSTRRFVHVSSIFFFSNFFRPQKIFQKTKADDEHTTTTTGPSPLPHPDVEHIIKSPPEPTRVKSPEQILMRSPDPVNWTVPLDTGKTFTVTQNVREGKALFCRANVELTDLKCSLAY